MNDADRHDQIEALTELKRLLDDEAADAGDIRDAGIRAVNRFDASIAAHGGWQAYSRRGSSVQRQLLLPLGVSHFCRFRSSWIKINNDDACGPCGRRLRRPKRGGKRAASTVTHCRSARARFPCRWRGPQAARLPDGPECSRGRPAVGSGQQRTGSTPAGSRRRRRFPPGAVRSAALARWKWQPARELAGRADRRLQPRGRRFRSVGTLPNPGRPPRPVSRRGRPGRRRPGRAARPITAI